jgi:hypothetical protein
MDVYDTLGRPIAADGSEQYEVQLVRQAGSGFGMNVKTLDSGRTVVTVRGYAPLWAPLHRKACREDSRCVCLYVCMCVHVCARVSPLSLLSLCVRMCVGVDMGGARVNPLTVAPICR